MGSSSLWNVAVGHGRAELADVAAEQMRKAAFTNNYTGYSNVPAIELADEAHLSGLAYDNLAGRVLHELGFRGERGRREDGALLLEPASGGRTR